MDKNTTLYIKVTEKGGKKYENLYCKTTLENGKEVIFQVKQAFFNLKFARLLAVNLPKEITKNGKAK